MPFVLTYSINAYSWESFKSDVGDGITDVKNIANDVAGSWCSGKEYGFSEMKISDRIETGSSELSEQIAELNGIAKQMTYDIEFNIDDKIKQSRNSSRQISEDTKKLCNGVKDSGFNEQEYGAIKLRDKNEILAQIRISLSGLKSSKTVVVKLAQYKVEFNRLNQRILDKANELAVLKKGFDNLKDPRSSNKSPVYFESTIRNACVAISESEELLMTYDNKSTSQLFRNASQNNQTSSISNSEIEKYMDTCEE